MEIYQNEKKSILCQAWDWHFKEFLTKNVGVQMVPRSPGAKNMLEVTVSYPIIYKSIRVLIYKDMLRIVAY